MSHVNILRPQRTIVGSQAAFHYRANMVPVPQPFMLAPQYQGDIPPDRIQSGLLAFHSLLYSIYHAGVETPEVLIPPNRSPRKQVLRDDVLAGYPRLLFAIGLYGERIEGSDPLAVRIPSKMLADFCTLARINSYESYFLALEKFGLAALLSQQVIVCFPPAPDLIPALVVFANACHPLTKKDINPPVEFLRADMRLLQIIQKKIRPVPLEPEEVFRTLRNDEEAAFLRDLDAWARSAGYIAELKCTGVHRSEFIAKYARRKPNRILFGLNIESGLLKMHINFNQAHRILPHIAKTPRSFRELFYKNCTCADCGACQDGPLKVELDEKMRRLCRYSYMNIAEVSAEHYDAIQYLIKAQDGILKEE